MGLFLELVNEYIMYETLAVIWVLHLWVTYLNLRQRKVEQTLVEVPSVVSNFMSKEVYEKSRLYAIDKSNFNIVDDFCGAILTTIYFLAFALLHWWNWSLSIAEYLGISPDSEILVSAICMILINFINAILNLPFKIYQIFVLEEKHGFNKQTPLFFIKDQVLMFLVMQVIYVLMISGAIWIIKNGGSYVFVYLWLFIVFVTLFMMMIYPEVIAPLFDKYTPLPEGKLRDQIEALAASLNYPLSKLFIVHGSKRSSHSNAYLYGFYKNKRIVLFDTLVKEYYKPETESDKDKGCDTEEILAILSHELGHWKFSHTIKIFVLMQIGLILSFLSFSTLLYYPPMYAAFGFEDSMPILIGLSICCYIFLPISTILQFVFLIVSRKFEFQADRFAVTLGHAEGLKSGLIKLQTDNLVFPMYDKFYSFWFLSHPSVLERLEAIDKAQ